MATLVNTGLEYIAKLINGVSVAPFKYIALGSGSMIESSDQTELESEHTTGGLGRAAAACSYEALGKARWAHTFVATTNGMQVNEVGIFDAAVDGNALMRHKYSSTKTLDLGEELSVVIVYTQERKVN